MDFALGMLTGMVIVFVIAKRLLREMKQEVELLKDFDTWKEWKNKSK